MRRGRVQQRGVGLLYALAMAAVLLGLASFIAVMTRQRVAQLQRTQWALQARLNARSGFNQFCVDHRVPKVPLICGTLGRCEFLSKGKDLWFVGECQRVTRCLVAPDGASFDGLSANYRYNTHDDLVETLWQNGLRETETFTPLGETLTRLTTFPQMGNLENELTVLDGLGRKKQWFVDAPGSRRDSSYTYDQLDQLNTSSLSISGQPTQNANYGFDANTNRTQFNNAASNFSSADRNTALGYSPAGAVSQDQNNNLFTYDWRDQLTTYRKGANNAQYSYDGNNLRLEKNSNGVSTKYLWDGSQVLKEYKGDGSVKAAYFLGVDRGAIKTGGQWYIYIKDSRGSITGMVDQAGNRVATYRASDFGEATVDQGSVYNPFRWNGEQVDSETGLVYLRNRYYQPSTGRFLQRDPIGYEGGLNLYAFCNGDPVNKNDPSGLDGDLKVHSRPGHSWLEYTYTSGTNAGKSHTYGAWPVTEDTPYSGVHVDVEKNLKLNSVSMSWHVKGKQEGDFQKWLRNEMQNRTWTPTSNCADFATQGWQFVTGEDLNNSSWRSAGIPSPDELMKSINPNQITLVNTGNSFTDSTGSGLKASSGLSGSLSGALTGGSDQSAQSLGRFFGSFWPWQ